VGSPPVAPYRAEAPDVDVRGFVHSPAGPPRAAMVLTHGAGSSCDAPLLVALASALAEEGVRVVRCDLPFRQRRARGGPGAGDAARDRLGLQRAVESLGANARPVFLGGQSYGGRQASMLLAEQPALADALLLLSYPLHPPGQPDRPRTSHLPHLRVPVMFVHGTRDPFGTIGEIEAGRALIAAPTTLLTVDGAGHDLGVRRGRDASGIARTIAQRFSTFVDAMARPATG
jgi:predicted alpha/beta-hydrolase family hydrolase